MQVEEKNHKIYTIKFIQGEIQIESPFSFVSIENIAMKLEVNEHPTLTIKAIIKEEEERSVFEKIGPDQEIIWSKSDGTILFVGIPYDFSIFRQGNLLFLDLICKGKVFY